MWMWSLAPAHVDYTDSISCTMRKFSKKSELRRPYVRLQYPLLLCLGEDGYSINVCQVDPPCTISGQANDVNEIMMMTTPNTRDYSGVWGVVHEHGLVQAFYPRCHPYLHALSGLN
ncbi:hypothetical protein J6590_022503 [Homalodisca vitripennis]|nr:hypothetical protein J6590_022503 [Homalodisca vitripennis]